jgi:hypothetical protein
VVVKASVSCCYFRTYYDMSYSVTTFPSRYSSAVASDLLKAVRSWYIHSILFKLESGMRPYCTWMRFESF